MKKLPLIVAFSILTCTCAFGAKYTVNTSGVVKSPAKTIQASPGVSVNQNYFNNNTSYNQNQIYIDKNKYIVEVSNNVDVNKLGNYEVIYNINYKKVKIELKRNVIVVDKEEPVLTVNLETVEKDYCTKQIISNLEYRYNR